MTWQPISTAPKDGTRIIANNSRLSYRPYIVEWQEAEPFPPFEEAHWGDGDDFFFNAGFFTHWMPLPSPPEDKP